MTITGKGIRRELRARAVAETEAPREPPQSAAAPFAGRTSLVAAANRAPERLFASRYKRLPVMRATITACVTGRLLESPIHGTTIRSKPLIQLTQPLASCSCLLAAYCRAEHARSAVEIARFGLSAGDFGLSLVDSPRFLVSN